jgi:hypothetical protein
MTGGKSLTDTRSFFSPDFSSFSLLAARPR